MRMRGNVVGARVSSLPLERQIQGFLAWLRMTSENKQRQLQELVVWSLFIPTHVAVKRDVGGAPESLWLVIRATATARDGREEFL
jgi:hypothetical protein